ncbi:hypothetical protein FH972_025231 [Carpinus fangiana]|uniref:NIMA interactive protein n=1 Tax=Carpinus fangiana TaxID=176857 RepID=A0A5N6L300_9ROSI|nr:hypothetical protein FH972_025231 [Carpinus fangiana]
MEEQWRGRLELFRPAGSAGPGQPPPLAPLCQARRPVNKTLRPHHCQPIHHLLLSSRRGYLTSMDAENLRTASTYINNLLLARGLLRNGTPIDFTSLAKPTALSSDDQENKENRTKPRKSTSNATTTAHVINLIHDLILRRDRDQTHLESLSVTLSTLRTDASHHNSEMERANSKAADAQRQVALRDAEARTATRAAKSAEASARKLRDEVQRVKSLLSQVRIQCEKDVKKKDVEYHKLKHLVHAQQRGANPGPLSKSSSDAYTIVDGKFGQNHRVKLPLDMNERLDPADPDYALKSEGKEFLAELSKGLSDENDSLIALIQATLGTLRELMGMEHNQPTGIKSFESSGAEGANELVTALPTSCAQLEKSLGVVLSSIRDLLTNPSFAPIEEVHVREEEIQRLREGWIMMEGRWREAVDMMQGWRKKMSGGHSINMDELRMGLKLGEGVQMFASSPMRPLPISGDVFPTSDFAQDEGDESFGADRLPGEEGEFETPDAALLQDLGELTVSNVSHGDLPDSGPTLAEVNENVDIRRGREQSKKVNFSKTSSGGDNLTSRPRSAATNQPGFMRPTSAAANRRGTKAAPKQIGTAKVSGLHLVQDAGTDQCKPKPSTLPTTTKQRRPGGAKLEAPRSPSPVLTVQQKLKLAEDEARRVSLSSTLDEDHQPSPPSSPLELNAAPPELAADDEVRARSPIRRSRMTGRPRRRKSTLSPEELEDLMMGNSAGTETF